MDVQTLKKYRCQLHDDMFITADSQPLWQDFNLGMELEYVYAPDVSRMACIAYMLGNNVLTLEDIRDYSRRSLIDISFLQMREFHRDGELDELVFYPMTLQAAKNLESHFRTLFASLQQHGYVDHEPLGFVGMHISIDKKIFPAEAMEKLLWWVFKNNKLWVWLTGRKNYSTIKADIWHLLGDTYHTWGSDYRESMAKELFGFFLSGYTLPSSSNEAGFRTYDVRPYFQITHFASTLKVEELFLRLEVVDSLLNWVNRDTVPEITYDPHAYCRWISKDKYPHIHESLKSLGL